MCRLLAYVAPEPTRISAVIGDEQCETFQRMGRLHDDGWGSMWVEGDRLRRQRDAATAFGDLRLAHALREPLARARAFHLRLATGSLAVSPQNTHPFVAGGIGLMHNGSIFPTDHVRGWLTPDVLADVRGQTDSELYHALVRQYAATGQGLPDAVAAAVGRLRTAYPHASLNAIVMDADHMVVVHSATTAAVPYDHFGARGLLPEELPADHDERYYRVGMLRTPDGAVAFSSTGLDRTGWLALPDDSMAVVDVRTAQMSVQLIAERSAA